MSISIVTRFGMLLDGVKVESKNLNVANEPSLFFATEEHFRSSIISADRSDNDNTHVESNSQIPSLLGTRMSSLSTPSLSAQRSSVCLQAPLLERSISVPSSSSMEMAMVKTESGVNRRCGKPSASRGMRLRFEKNSTIDLVNESAEGLVHKLLPFCSPQQFSSTNPNLYKCGLCHQVYGGLKSFGEHVNSHSKIKNKCHVCGRVFTRSWLLKGHLRIHTGEKPFQCTACGKRFADKSNMRSHLLTHTVTKRAHACERCGKTFAQRRYLRKHILEVCSRLSEESGAVKKSPE